MGEEGAELVAGANEQGGLRVHVDDQRDRFEEHRVLRVRVLNLLRLWRLLRLIQDTLQALQQARLVRWVFCRTHGCFL